MKIKEVIKLITMKKDTKNKKHNEVIYKAFSHDIFWSAVMEEFNKRHDTYDD